MIKKNNLINEIEESAEDYVRKNQISSIPFSGYETYLEKGNRQEFENGYMLRRRQLAVMGLKCILKPTEIDISFLEQLIWEICNEYSWAVPAHLPIENGVFSKSSKLCLDLFAAETANALSQIKYSLKDFLSPMIQNRISEEIKIRVFTPFLREVWFWETSGNNWSSVIPASVGMAALQELEVEKAFQKKILSKVNRCLDIYLNSFSEDGACIEGVGYWSYGFGYYIYFAEMYYRMRKDSKYLDDKKVKEIAKFPARIELDEGKFVPFSDYTQTKPPTGLLSFCKNYFQIAVPIFSTISKLDEDHCYRFAHIFRNIYWTKEEYKTRITDRYTHYFSESQWIIKKDRGVIFASKGGNNDEAHNHNDVGHFIYGTIDDLFLTDLGAGMYTKKYFEDRYRYDIVTNSSKGHSLPIVNGEYQMAGKYSAGRVELTENKFKMSLESLYNSRSRLEKLTRNFDISSVIEGITVEDIYSFSKNNNVVVENFVTLIKPEKTTKGILIQGLKSKCLITFNTEKVVIEKERYLDHSGREATVYFIKAIYEGDKKIITKVSLNLKKYENEGV